MNFCLKISPIFSGIIKDYFDSHPRRSLLDPLGIFHTQPSSHASSSSKSTSLSGKLNLGLIKLEGSISKSSADANAYGEGQASANANSDAQSVTNGLSGHHGSSLATANAAAQANSGSTVHHIHPVEPAIPVEIVPNPVYGQPINVGQLQPVYSYPQVGYNPPQGR